MTQAFINDKKLEFVESDGKDGLQDFWGGVDKQGEHFHELFFESGPEGQTPSQIERYTAFCGNLNAILNSLGEKINSHLAVQDEATRKGCQNGPLCLDIIVVKPDGSDADMEINCELRQRRVLFFTACMGYFTRLRNNRIIEFE